MCTLGSIHIPRIRRKMENLSLYGMQLLATTALVLLIMYQIVTKLIYRGRKHNSLLLPGATGFPFIGETLQFMAALKSDKGIYEFVRIRRSRYGDSFRTKLLGTTQVFFSSSESVKAILGSESGKFTKRYVKSVAELLGKRSILCASQQHHKLIRRRLAGFFAGNYLSEFVRQFDRLVVENLETWESKDTVVILHEALKISCEAMCEMLMSVESGHKLEVLQAKVATVCKAMLAFPIKLPGTRFHKGLQARKHIMSIIEEEISERRRGLVGQHHDLLQRLLDLDERTGCDLDKTETLVDDEIKDNILTMIIAGQDTTASAITWMVKYLDENPHVLLKLKDEQLQLSRKSPRNAALSLDDLNDMSFASKVVKESLRMSSIVAWFPRVSLNDIEIEGYEIKKGWIVNVDARQVHHDPRLYNDPYTFNPSRSENDAKPNSFLAFGMGSRACLGANTAKAMMLVFLYRLTTTFSWEVKDKDPSIEKWAMFSTLKTGCPITLKRISNHTTR